MSNIARTDQIFFENTGLDQSRVEKLVSDTLRGADDGELFLEYCQSESLFLDDGKIRAANFDTTQGFGLRSIAGEVSGYAHSSELSEAALKRAANTVQAVHSGHSGTFADAPNGTNNILYTDENPLGDFSFEQKVKLLGEIDAYARAKDPRVSQVSASIAGEWQAVQIVRPSGLRVADIRPLVRLNISVVVTDGDRMETGSYGTGGRVGFGEFVTEASWQASVDEALRQALVNLDAIPAPAGEMTVVLGSGWPGILLHEAVGHGLEGDFNRKKTSAFSGLLGQRVASPGVTVIDDGTIHDRRGSLTIDDEGTPTAKTVLIEDGILKGYMQDRMNARLMGMTATGNGRRQSHAHAPMPRMTNTYMLGGDKDPQEILESVKDGIYAVNFGGGQVDITNGKFVFSCTEAYKIENGKLGAPLKGATLIGNGPESMQRVSMIGNDMALDPGIGTCGKDGQGVPVGVGQPTLRMDGLTVGGTAA
ncbi:metalloprotease TldD [Aestuariispira insulae]|uniref:TldD protein n=1 Tax=Aestuariispira insulae TaxID=1461337 RepID=A0A3D9H7V9_9PROT|nr:metalloprotease TldD [Aestuariispira insulae]RED45046.1 TldD protein [Aestuariispira insulae]